MFLVDGPVLLAEALAAGTVIDAVYADAAMEQDPAVRAALASGVRVTETAPDALAKVLDLKTPRGVVAIARAATTRLEDVLDAAVRDQRPVLVLVSLQDPGNVGTLVRVAEASECAGVVLTRGSVDLHNPKTVRATAGAVFRVPVAEHVEVTEVVDRCDRAGLATYATIGRTGIPVESARLGGGVAILVGAEAHGLPDEVVERCSDALTVPMAGGVESLNAAIAGAVVLFDAARQRRGLTEVSSGSDPSGGDDAPMGHNGDPINAPADGRDVQDGDRIDD